MHLAEQYKDIEVFFAADYSQLEIRVLAQMSRDERLIELIKTGEDIHCMVGQELTGIPFKKIKDDRETRTAIKGIHFGIVYGLQPHSLYLALKVGAAERGEKFEMSEEEVTRLYLLYFKKFKGVKKFLDAQVAFAEEHGYVTTLFGFKREISLAGEEGRDTFWANQAMNTPIQGTAHQLMMMALSLIETNKSKYPLLQNICMEIHDSLVWYVRLADLPEIYKQALQLLQFDVLAYVVKKWPEIDWKVPLKADAKVGLRLGVLVEKYKGEPPQEFIEKWCEENERFENKFAEDMKSSKGQVV